MPAAARIRWSELRDWLSATALLGQDGEPQAPMAFVDLTDLTDSTTAHDDDVLACLAQQACGRILVGIHPPASRCEAQAIGGLDFCLSESPVQSKMAVQVDDIAKACQDLEMRILSCPRAALILASLLRASAGSDTRQGLERESQAYSLLQSGPEFSAWLGRRGDQPAVRPETGEEALVDMRREGDVLHLVLNDPVRHNALSRRMRDDLLECLELALVDGRVQIHMTGRGASFCSGGDLCEFGLAREPVASHLVRLESSVAWRLHLCARRLRVALHGACVGAGAELAAFAHQVSAHRDTFLRLPELGMGLLPGAGGTVSIPRRIGRWRAAYLMLSGQTIGALTAAEWGLVDEVLS